MQDVPYGLCRTYLYTTNSKNCLGTLLHMERPPQVESRLFVQLSFYWSKYLSTNIMNLVGLLLVQISSSAAAPLSAASKHPCAATCVAFQNKSCEYSVGEWQKACGEWRAFLALGEMLKPSERQTVIDGGFFSLAVVISIACDGKNVDKLAIIKNGLLTVNKIKHNEICNLIREVNFLRTE